MEVIGGTSRGVVTGCSCLRQNSLPSASAARSVVVADTFCHLRCRRGRLQTSLSWAVSFQDQGHEQFYRSSQNGGRGKGRLVKAVAGLDEGLGVDPGRNFRKARKMEMKMQKKLKKGARVAAVVSSSSSGSSSDSEEGERTERRGRLSRRIDMEEFGREWGRISQSPLMSTVPKFSTTFETIEQPQQVAAPAMGIGCDSQTSEVTPAVVSNELMKKLMAMGLSAVAGMRGHNALQNVPGAQSDAGSARVEVCMGGKCKRAGAQDVMSAFKANGVPACGAKCMKKCKLAVNVRLDQEDGDVPQMYSGVGVSDVNALSQKYFGAGTLSRSPGSSSPLVGTGQM